MTAENSDCPSLKSRIGERKISSVSDFGRFMFNFVLYCQPTVCVGLFVPTG